MEKKQTLISALLLMFFALLAGGSTEEYGTFLLIAIPIAIPVVIIFNHIQGNRRDKRTQKLEKVLSSRTFNASTKIIDEGARFLFAIDQEQRKIMMAAVDNSEADFTSFCLINFADIISVELLEDSNVSFSKSTMRVIGGGLIGGAIAGGAGAVVGGLSGDSNVKKEVSKIQIKLLVRNQKVPNFIFDCYDGIPLNSNEEPYKETMREIYSVVDHISVIINMMDREYQHQENLLISEPKTQSIADELEKLCALRDKGILSAEEFEKQKAKILS